VTHPPYPQWWYKKIITQTNDHFKVKKLKSETEKP
jgi:hypothetical protein